jgi:predicted XRE-type DNA-binding protein
LISIRDGGVVLLLDDFAGLSQKSIAAVLKLETERISAMMKLGFMA